MRNDPIALFTIGHPDYATIEFVVNNGQAYLVCADMESLRNFNLPLYRHTSDCIILALKAALNAPAGSEFHCPLGNAIDRFRGSFGNIAIGKDSEGFMYFSVPAPQDCGPTSEDDDRVGWLIDSQLDVCETSGFDQARSRQGAQELIGLLSGRIQAAMLNSFLAEHGVKRFDPATGIAWLDDNGVNVQMVSAVDWGFALTSIFPATGCQTDGLKESVNSKSMEHHGSTSDPEEAAR